MHIICRCQPAAINPCEIRGEEGCLSFFLHTSKYSEVQWKLNAQSIHKHPNLHICSKYSFNPPKTC